MSEIGGRNAPTCVVCGGAHPSVDHKFAEDRFLHLGDFEREKQYPITNHMQKHFDRYHADFEKMHKKQFAPCIRCEVPDGVNLDGYCWICALHARFGLTEMESKMLRWNRRTSRVLQAQQEEEERQVELPQYRQCAPYPPLSWWEVCVRCGVRVLDKKAHDDWHKELGK